VSLVGMVLARGGSGVGDEVRAVASQVHPVFMLPAVASSLFGAVLVGVAAPVPLALHATAVFAGLYLAHVTDGYVDFYVRGEDDDTPLTAVGCRVLQAAATVLFAACTVGLWVTVDVGAALVTLPGWFVAAGHAPQLDTNPVTATCGYPLGVALALVGGAYAQTGALTAVPVAFGVVFLVVLSGVKVVDDATDYEYDRAIDKRTVAVVLGRERAHRVAYGLMTTGLLAVVAFAATPVFPPSAMLAVVPFAAVALVARGADASVATMLLVRGSYLFLAVLLVAVHWQPLAGTW
jgi:1,4-dihydroxy-2-naphthoate octaprenyltransferase